MREAERAHLANLADALRVRLDRDECGDPVIQGRRGSIHADGSGFSAAAVMGTARLWASAKTKLLGFCQLQQNGEDEGVFHLSALPTRGQARLLRAALGIRKQQQYAPAVLEKKRTAVREARKVLSARALPAPKTGESVASGMSGRSRQKRPLQKAPQLAP